MAFQLDLDVQFESLGKDGTLLLLPDNQQKPTYAVSKSTSTVSLSKCSNLACLPASKCQEIRQSSNCENQEKSKSPSILMEKRSTPNLLSVNSVGTPPRRSRKRSKTNLKHKKRDPDTLSPRTPDLSPQRSTKSLSKELPKQLSNAGSSKKSSRFLDKLLVHTPEVSETKKKKNLEKSKDRKSTTSVDSELPVTFSSMPALSQTCSGKSKDSKASTSLDSELPVTFSNMPTASLSASISTIPSATKISFSEVFNQPIGDKLAETISNQQLINEFQKFSVGYQERRERELHRECVAWMLLCVAIAVLFYYRAEKIIQSGCKFN